MTKPGNFGAHLACVRKLSPLPDTTFSEYFREVMKAQNFTSKKLVDDSKLTNETVSHMRSGQVRPKINTILSAFIAMKVPPFETQKALSLAGYDFIAGDEVHDCYKVIVTDYYKASIDECNEHLKSQGVRDSDLLGQVKGSKLSADIDIE